MAHDINVSSAYELPGAEQEQPRYGILTRTLIHTPVVKQIIPARIRGKEFNDVVFVGETHIELFLLDNDGKLRKIASKFDFHADIRHAVVFATSNRVRGMPDIFPEDIMAEDTKRKLPPHILVLTLDSGYIGFLYAVTKGDEVDFIMSTRKIDEKGVKPKTLGKSLAVDPKSRCLAVTAYQDSFRIFSLYEPDELERQLQAGTPLMPVREDKTFTVSGLILHMEFLHPTRSDIDNVILVIFIVDVKQKFRLVLYEWCTSKPLSTAAQHGRNGLPLPDEVTIPLHLIPLLVGTAFLLISETCIHAIRALDIQSGNLRALAKFDFPRVPSDRGKKSLVTSWARPLRTSSHTQTMDDLYLAMEDGDIFFLELGSEGPNLVKLVNKAGHLDCAIGSAFAALDYGLERNDLIIAGGEMSSGGIYLIGPSYPPYPPSNLGTDDEPKLEETVANWSPVFDFDLINHSAQGYSQGRAMRDRMYACTGRGEHGAIAEIRTGIQGLIHNLVEYFPGIRNIWVLPSSEGLGFFLLCSFPDRSSLCYRDQDGEWDDVSHYDFLDMYHTTIAAAAIGQKSVQITPKAVNIHILREENLGNNRGPGVDIVMADGDTDEDGSVSTECASTMWSRRCGEGDHIVAAAIQGIYLVVVIKTAGSIKMTLATILPELDAEGAFLEQIGPEITDFTSNEDPSFVTISEISGQLFVIIGTREATIQFYLIDSTNGLVPTREQSLLRETDAGNIVQRDLYICESAIPIQSSTSTQLLCGLRDGTLVTFDASLSLGDLQLFRKDDIQFGPIPVQVLPHAQKRDVALVLAGPELYRFGLSASEVKISQIVFEGILIEPAIVAVAQTDTFPGLDSFIVCATKDQLFYAEVGVSEKVCVRRLPLMETPKRLLYHKKLNVLIVAVSKSVLIEPSGPNPGTKTRVSSPSLCFLNPQTGGLLGEQELTDSNLEKQGPVCVEQDEQIYGLSEWNVEIETKDGPKNFRYIAIGTGFINIPSNQSKKGRVIILSVSLNSGRIGVRCRYQISCDAPVYSVAGYGKRSIVYCTGNKLCMRRLNIDVQPKKLEEVAEFRLRSPAGQITVNEPYINCSCATDSLCIIKFEEASSQHSKFHLHYSDEKARPGFSHYSPLENFFIVSDKEYGIVGLWQPPNKRNTGSLTTLFDTEVTSSISRLRGGSLRPPWHAQKPRPGVLLPDKDIIGSGVDGSIFHLTLLNVDALRLLRYIQGMYTSHLETRKTSDSFSTPKVSAINTRLRMDVDGDILLAMQKLGEDWLRKAVQDEETNIQAGGKAGMSFGEMVEKVLGPMVVAENERKDDVTRTLEYIKELLDGVVL